MGLRRDTVRSTSARVVWVLCAGVALWLGLAALFVGLRVDEESVAGAVVRWAAWVDLPHVARGHDVLPGLALDSVQRTVGAWAGAALLWLLVGLLGMLALRPRDAATTLVHDFEASCDYSHLHSVTRR